MKPQIFTIFCILGIQISIFNSVKPDRKYLASSYMKNSSNPALKRFLSKLSSSKPKSPTPTLPNVTEGLTAQNVLPACPISNFWELIDNKDNKYYLDSYEVTTEDNYTLQMFRIRLSVSELKKLTASQQSNRYRPVMLEHG